MIEPRGNPSRRTPRAAALLALAALAAGWGGPRLTAQQPPMVGGEGAGSDQEAVPADPLAQARAALRQAETDAAQRAVAAKTLLDAGETEVLRAILGGEDAVAALALLQALAAQPPVSCEPLVADVLALDARRPDTPIAAAADALLGSLASVRPTVLTALQAELTAPGVSAERRRAVLRSLGQSRHLGATDALIAGLDGPEAATAREALARLTGHDLGAAAGSEAWGAWWQANRHLARDQLLELAIEAERARFDKLREALEQEVIKARLDKMGQEDLARLTDGLSDAFAEVRVEAVRRLMRHTNQAQAAATAVPVMLVRLGYAVTAGGTTNGAAGAGTAVEPGTASPAASAEVGASPESDPAVRVALVEALGTLGRTRDDVRAALIAELRGSESAALAAGAAGLRLMRDQPDVVVSLLDDLERRPGEQDGFETLQAVAANRPVGVIPRLVPWLDADQSARVRGAAVRALVASENHELALDHLEAMYAVGDTPPDVRFAMAKALGERVPELEGKPAWDRAFVLLTALLDSAEPNVRAEAVAALGRTGAREALDLLDARSRNETDPEVVRRIVDAIGALGLPRGGGVIGRVVASRKDLRASLEPVAREALTTLADQGGPADWLSLGEAVGGAGAHSLACWCYRELITRYEAGPENKDAIDRARGRLASDLYMAGQADEALALLLDLEAGQAPYPSPIERLDLLARANEDLGRFSEAADYHLKRFAMLPEGERQRTATRKAAVEALRQAERYADALVHLRELVRADGADNGLLFDLARTEEAAGQYDQARVDLERLLERIPESDRALRQDVEAVLERVLRALEGKPPPELVPSEDVPAVGPTEGAPDAGERAGPAPAPDGEAPGGQGAPAGEPEPGAPTGTAPAA